MILTVLTLINTLLCLIYYEFKVTLLQFFVILFIQANISFIIYEIIKKILEKFFDIEFLNAVDKWLAVCYDRKKFLGDSQENREYCNIYGLLIFENKINPYDLIKQLKNNIFMHKYYHKLKKVSNFKNENFLFFKMFFWQFLYGNNFINYQFSNKIF